jgi:hypothetical protein
VLCISKNAQGTRACAQEDVTFVRTKMVLCARRSRRVRTKMMRENTGVRTKITKIWGSMRVVFVRTELDLGN